MTKPEVDKVLDEVDAWIQDDQTWNEDLDGYHGPDIAEAVLREVRRRFEEVLGR